MTREEKKRRVIVKFTFCHTLHHSPPRFDFNPPKSPSRHGPPVILPAVVVSPFILPDVFWQIELCVVRILRLSFR